MTRHDPVLISGCSSGIGAATAAALVRAGHTVYATARRTETLADLEALGCHPLALDVTSEDSMIAAVKAVEAEHGQVGTLINNAGYGEYGPIEESRPRARADHVRDQRVRARATHPAGPARDASVAFRPDRQHRVDGRTDHLPRRRFLPRDQVRRRSHQRRPPGRGQAVRHRRHPRGAGPDPHQLREPREREPRGGGPPAR